MPKNCWSSTANKSPFKVFRLTQLFIYKYQRKCCNPWPNPQGNKHRTLLVWEASLIYTTQYLWVCAAQKNISSYIQQSQSSPNL